MRPGLTPDQFRAAGIYLNGGRKRGWRKHLARLLHTPEPTIAAWASRSPSNARSIPGTAAVAIKLLVALLQQRESVERDLRHASDIIAEQVLALLHLPDFAKPDTRPSERLTAGSADMPLALTDQPPGDGAAGDRAHLAAGRQRLPRHAP